MKVLLVDDDPQITNGLSRHMRKERWETDQAATVASAKDMLNSEQYDAVVSDYHMPGDNGIEFLRYCAEHYPDIVRIMLTGAASMDITISAINEGHVNHFLVKPTTAREVMFSIKKEHQHHQALHAVEMLYKRTKQQDQLLGKLQEEFPDISSLNKDSDGSIIIDLEPLDESIVNVAEECVRNRPGR